MNYSKIIMLIRYKIKHYWFIKKSIADNGVGELFGSGGVFWPVVLIANVAAFIASRAMTTATFSCIKQSTALGCFPRLKIIHTSRKFMGQIYIPVINWFLLVFCLLFVSVFESINEIGNAYGKSRFRFSFCKDANFFL